MYICKVANVSKNKSILAILATHKNLGGKNFSFVFF